jgi:hypothetical protein
VPESFKSLGKTTFSPFHPAPAGGEPQIGLVMSFVRLVLPSDDFLGQRVGDASPKHEVE